MYNDETKENLFQLNLNVETKTHKFSYSTTWMFSLVNKM